MKEADIKNGGRDGGFEGVGEEREEGGRGGGFEGEMKGTGEERDEGGRSGRREGWNGGKGGGRSGRREELREDVGKMEGGREEEKEEWEGRQESYLVPNADRAVPEPGSFDRSAECTPTQHHWYSLCHLCMRTQ